MKFIFKIWVLAAAIIFGMATGCRASPCSGIDQTLTEPQKTALQPIIGEQLLMKEHLQTDRVDILQNFQEGNWQIVLVDPHVADPAYLFFSSDPGSRQYITLWSGAATLGEEPEIYNWVMSNAPGIPSKLAKCFAWHVTKK